MKKVWSIIIALAAVCAVGLYIFDIVYNKTPYLDHLFKVLVIVLGSLSAIIRLNTNTKRQSLEFYEGQYSEEIGNAFADRPILRKKLLCAIRLYNENSLKKALKYLTQLKKNIKYTDDAEAIYLFAALSFSDAGLYEDAIMVYNSLLKIQPRNPRNYSNMGLLYSAMGKDDKAMEHYLTAIRVDENYAQAYNNAANLFFKESKYESAIRYAEKALLLKSDLYTASGLLAIIYALLGDEEAKKKYFHMAVASGKNPDDLSRAIKIYLKEKEIEEE